MEMSDNAGKLSSVRKFKGIVHTMVTRLEAQISKLEEKPEITASGSMMIQAHTERFNSLDSDFKKHHQLHIIELVDEEHLETLEREQALLDDHEGKMNDIMDRLIWLGHTKPSLSVVAPPISLEVATESSRLLYRSLRHLESSLRSVNEVFKPLAPGPDLDDCLVQQLQEQVSHLRAQPSDVACDSLSLEQEDQSLLVQELALDKAFLS